MSKWMAALALVVVAVLAAGLVAFEPWRAFTSSTVDDAFPEVASDVALADEVTSEANELAADEITARKTSKRRDEAQVVEPTPQPTPRPQPEVAEIARGSFIDAEHATSGVAKVIALSDGSRFVRLEDFSTSDGPDVFVGLSESPSGGSWGSYDDLRYVQLGSLKATDGNQNYEIPADVDLAGLESVVIWCNRFDVAFGTAPVSL